MGYRSEVAFVISFKTKEEVDNYIAPRLLDENLSWARNNFTRVHNDPASIMFYHPEIKWYDSYPDVQALTNLYQDVIDAGGAYNFIRIGEDDDDIQTESESSEDSPDPYYDDFYPIRSIQTPDSDALKLGE